MAEDARLDDFLDEAGAGPAPADEVGTDEPDVEAAEQPAPDPREPTSTWRPDARCERCEQRADRRWRSIDGLVCSDCAEWS